MFFTMTTLNRPPYADPSVIVAKYAVGGFTLAFKVPLKYHDQVFTKSLASEYRTNCETLFVDLTHPVNDLRLIEEFKPFVKRIHFDYFFDRPYDINKFVQVCEDIPNIVSLTLNHGFNCKDQYELDAFNKAFVNLTSFKVGWIGVDKPDLCIRLPSVQVFEFNIYRDKYNVLIDFPLCAEVKCDNLFILNCAKFTHPETITRYECTQRDSTIQKPDSTIVFKLFPSLKSLYVPTITEKCADLLVLWIGQLDSLTYGYINNTPVMSKLYDKIASGSSITEFDEADTPFVKMKINEKQYVDVGGQRIYGFKPAMHMNEPQKRVLALRNKFIEEESIRLVTEAVASTQINTKKGRVTIPDLATHTILSFLYPPSGNN